MSDNQAEERTVSTGTSAEVFERLFLPALAGPWAARVADAAQLAPGDRVLDVACGTGAVTREALQRIGPGGAVTGLDCSPEMLAVARRKLPDIEFREGRAEELPFGDRSFDAVVCQFALMYFDDRQQALREMRRVLRPGGRVAAAVWDRLERTPGYAALTELVEKHLGPDAGKPIRDAFALGDVGAVRSLFESAGFASVEVASVDATARFPSLGDWVEAEVRGWVGGDFGDEAYGALLDEASGVLARYRRPDGSVEFDLPAIVATGRAGQ
jgi:ubiquinone/menaquinone biosynthesis C-methylase UbiE